MNILDVQSAIASINDDVLLFLSMCGKSVDDHIADLLDLQMKDASCTYPTILKT